MSFDMASEWEEEMISDNPIVQDKTPITIESNTNATDGDQEGPTDIPIRERTTNGIVPKPNQIDESNSGTQSIDQSLKNDENQRQDQYHKDNRGDQVNKNDRDGWSDKRNEIQDRNDRPGGFNTHNKQDRDDRRNERRDGDRFRQNERNPDNRRRDGERDDRRNERQDGDRFRENRGNPDNRSRGDGRDDKRNERRDGDRFRENGRNPDNRRRDDDRRRDRDTDIPNIRRNDRGNERTGDKKDEKVRLKNELYIPPEPTMDEAKIFSTGIGSGINFSRYDDIPVEVTGENVPKPIAKFEEAGLTPFIMKNIERCKYEQPTPIQKYAIPIVMAKRDLMGCAQTGSGKTAAYMLPIINDLLNDSAPSNGRSPQVVVITPTRELSTQIFEEARKFSFNSHLKVCNLYGGTGVNYQSSTLTNGCHIVVATVGRLLDFLHRRKIDFNQLRYFIFDEADKMLDMGFRDNITDIMKNYGATEDVQKLMFSATFPMEIQLLAGSYLHNYCFVAVGKVGGVCSDVEQNIYKVERFQKRDKLVELLTASDPSGTLVFVETKRSADFLACFLSESDFPTTSIHGDRQQQQREEALREFKTGRMKILIATSVAARGLDIKNVHHVINYDLPKEIEQFVHRVGRTGRVGNRGLASSFFDPQENHSLAAQLVQTLSDAKQNIPDFLKQYATRTYNAADDTNGDHSFTARDVRSNRNNDTVVSDLCEPNEAW